VGVLHFEDERGRFFIVVQKMRSVLPVPPFEFFGVGIGSSSEVNGTPEYIEKASIYFATFHDTKAGVKNFRIFTFQVGYVQDIQLNQVTGNGPPHTRDGFELPDSRRFYVSR